MFEHGVGGRVKIRIHSMKILSNRGGGGGGRAEPVVEEEQEEEAEQEEEQAEEEFKKRRRISRQRFWSADAVHSNRCDSDTGRSHCPHGHQRPTFSSFRTIQNEAEKLIYITLVYYCNTLVQ